MTDGTPRPAVDLPADFLQRVKAACTKSGIDAKGIIAEVLRKVRSREDPVDLPHLNAALVHVAKRRGLLVAFEGIVKERRPAPLRAPSHAVDEAATSSQENPWAGRHGWEDEPPLPIIEETVLIKDKETGEKRPELVPIEPGYVVYNRLIGQHRARPFRTTSGEPRVAIPTEHGVEVRDPSAEGFADAIAFRYYMSRGQRVPRAALATAVVALREQALARELGEPRIVDLSLRVAPNGDGTLLDLNDRRRRCVKIAGGEWSLESLGHPVFDTPAHMRELPEPSRAASYSEGWHRYERLWEFVRVPEGDLDTDSEAEGEGVQHSGGDPRLLVAAQHVQFLLAPNSPKPITAIIADENAGKTWACEKLQELVDPSGTPSVGAPESRDALADLAYNRAVLNLDNLSEVEDWLSDDLARLCTGAGLAKRRLYSDRGEVLARRIPWIIFNGITATPERADLIRRANFVPIEPPDDASALPRTELESKWRAALPDLLGGLLDLAALTSAVLAGPEPPGPGKSSDMADFVRIGRAVAVAMGKNADAFDAAWARNLRRQSTAASENPWVGILLDAFRSIPQDVEVTAEKLAGQIGPLHRQMFPKGVTPQMVGTQISRAKRTLERHGVFVRKRILKGVSQYKWSAEKLAPPAPPRSTLSSKNWGGAGGEAEKSPTPAPPGKGGAEGRGLAEPNLAPPPGISADSRRETSSGGGCGGAGGPISAISENAPVMEESENWTVPPRDRARPRGEHD
jgi:hypothetical protein